MSDHYVTYCPLWENLNPSYPSSIYVVSPFGIMIQLESFLKKGHAFDSWRTNLWGKISLNSSKVDNKRTIGWSLHSHPQSQHTRSYLTKQAYPTLSQINVGMVSICTYKDPKATQYFYVHKIWDLIWRTAMKN